MVKNNHYQDQPKGAPGSPADPPGLPPGLGAMGLGGPRPQIPNLPGPRGPSPGATGPMASPNVPPAKEKRKKSLPVRNLLQNMLKMRYYGNLTFRNIPYCCIKQLILSGEKAFGAWKGSTRVDRASRKSWEWWNNWKDCLRKMWRQDSNAYLRGPHQVSFHA